MIKANVILDYSKWKNKIKDPENYLEKILEKITSLELDKNSIILIMSDHGISVGEKVGERAYGAFCYDYTLRTFAYFMYQNIEPTEVKQQVRTIDFMPTILDYLDLSLSNKYEKIDGKAQPDENAPSARLLTLSCSGPYQ